MANFKFITSNNPNVQNVNTGKFSNQVFQNFVNNQQFNDAADYLNQFRFETDSKLDNKYKNIINSLRKQADFVQNATANLTDDERDAFAFHYAMTNNLKLPENSVVRGRRNSYTDRYRASIDALGGKESDEIVIGIKNNKEDSFFDGIRDFFLGNALKSTDAFFEALGYKSADKGIKELQGLGVNVNRDGTGETSIRFNKSNQNIINILNAVNGINLNNVTIYGIQNKDGKDIFRKIIDYNSDNTNTPNPASFITDAHKSRYLINTPSNIIQEAADKSRFNESKSAYDEDIIQGSVVGLGFKSAAHAKIQELRDRGMIDGTMYDDKMKDLDNQLMSHLQSDLSEYDVYYSNSEDRALDQVQGNEVKNQISDYIKLAIDNNQKINVQEAHVNGVFGTLIEIPGNLATKDYHELGNYTLDTNANTGKFEGGDNKPAESRTIFIKNFDGSDDEQELVNDPKMQAIRHLTTMNNTTSSYELGNGLKLKANGNDSYSLIEQASGLNANGVWHQINHKVRDLSKEEAQQMLAKDMYAQDVARDLETLLTDENGEINTNNAKEILGLYSPIFLRKLSNLYNTSDENTLSTVGDDFMDLISKILGINLRNL